MDSFIREVRCEIIGDVQNVGYRQFVAHKARSLELFGYVRNYANGSVEVIAQGSRKDLEELLAFLRVGPPEAKVSSLTTDWRDPDYPLFSSFDVKFGADE